MREGKIYFEFEAGEVEQLRKIQARVNIKGNQPLLSLEDVLTKAIEIYDSLTNMQYSTKENVTTLPPTTNIGCVCPIGANTNCENPICPRKNPLNQKGFPRFYST